MPLYEYICGECRRKFERLVRRFGDAVDCPGCGSTSVEKQLSTFAVASSSAAPVAADGCGASACGRGACGSGACDLPN
jgi:putative FmdB family regulatory protein